MRKRHVKINWPKHSLDVHSDPKYVSPLMLHCLWSFKLFKCNPLSHLYNINNLIDVSVSIHVWMCLSHLCALVNKLIWILVRRDFIQMDYCKKRERTIGGGKLSEIRSVFLSWALQTAEQLGWRRFSLVGRNTLARKMEYEEGGLSRCLDRVVNQSILTWRQPVFRRVCMLAQLEGASKVKSLEEGEKTDHCFIN